MVAFFTTLLCGTISVVFFFQAEDGIRDLVRSRGLGDVYKRQGKRLAGGGHLDDHPVADALGDIGPAVHQQASEPVRSETPYDLSGRPRRPSTYRRTR